MALLIIGCATLSPFREEPPSTDPRIEAERKFDPLDMDEDDLIVTESSPPREGDEAERSFIPTPPPDAENSGRKRQGFRIQIYASDSRELAQNVAREAQERLQERIYIKFDAPYYKVRLGDCLTREDAQRTREKAIRAGYENAWVVETTISADEESRD